MLPPFSNCLLQLNLFLVALAKLALKKQLNSDSKQEWGLFSHCVMLALNTE